MSLLIADIMSEANGRTHRAETDIDIKMKSLLHDLTNRGCFLEAEESEDLVTNQPNYTFSTVFTNDFKQIKTVVIIDANDVPSGPLTEISWKDYKERLAANLSASEPVEYCIFPKNINRVIYLSPKPNATLYPSMKVSGPIRHADSTTIAFPERFRELLIEGICWQIEKHYNSTSDKTKEHFGYYEREVTIHFGDVPTIGLGKYSDI